MNKFYCNICEEEVTLQNGKCPKCKTKWNKVSGMYESIEEIEPVDLNKSNESKTEKDLTYVKKITEDDIDNNINFFLTWGRVGKILIILLAIIIAIMSIVNAESTDGQSLFSLIISASLIIYAVILENSLKWKAYMLYTNNKRKK